MHALHYANELLVRVRFSFQKLLQTRSTKKCLRVQTTINYISILTFLCFFTTISTSKKMCFFFRARSEKGIARHIDASSVVWTLVVFDWFVLSMRMQVILDSSCFRPPGFSSYRGREERRVQGLDYEKRRESFLIWPIVDRNFSLQVDKSFSFL